MKKVFLLAAILTVTIAAQANSNVELKNATNTLEVGLNEDEQEKVPVKIEELPDAIRKVLASDSYKGWKAETAFLIKGDAPYYEINLKNAAGESATVKLDEAGSPVEK